MAKALFFYSDLTKSTLGQLITVDGSEAKHALSSRRLNIGEEIQLGDGRGCIVSGTIRAVTKQSLEMEVNQIQNFERPKTSITLVQALAKGDRDELAIQAATELGVMAVIPWQAERSISVWKAEKAEKGSNRWQSIVQEATKQSLRAFVPEVLPLMGTQRLLDQLKTFNQVFVLEPMGAKKLTQFNFSGAASIALVVGPEGGISPTELEQFQEAGHEIVRLGSSILRTSTAGLAAITYLQSQLGDWS